MLEPQGAEIATLEEDNKEGRVKLEQLKAMDKAQERRPTKLKEKFKAEGELMTKQDDITLYGLLKGYLLKRFADVVPEKDKNGTLRFRASTEFTEMDWDGFLELIHACLSGDAARAAVSRLIYRERDLSAEQLETQVANYNEVIKRLYSGE